MNLSQADQATLARTAANTLSTDSLLLAEANLLEAKLLAAGEPPKEYATPNGQWPFNQVPTWAAGVKYYRSAIALTLHRTHGKTTAATFASIKNLHDAAAFAKACALGLELSQ